MTQAQTTPEPEAKDSISSAKKFTYYVFLATLCLWGYSMWADRVTPMTDQGRVNGQIIRISPQVSGPIELVHVSDNARVSQSQLLVSIEKQPFELAVKAARLSLQQATQTFHADSAAIDAAKANQVAAQVQVSNAKQHLDRNKELARTGVVSKATLDDSQSSLDTALANLAQMTAALEKARQQLGPQGENNPQIQTALNNLEQALLNLSYTNIEAPGDGVVTNMNLGTGNFAAAGQPLVTFINNEHLWLTAMVRENSLAHIKPGIKVKVVFDAFPGEVYEGEVSSVGWGSSGNGSLQVDNSNGLFDSPTNSQKAQRFPVNVTLVNAPAELRYNGRAVVSFYPGESAVGEFLLDLWTRVWSYLSYVS